MTRFSARTAPSPSIPRLQIERPVRRSPSISATLLHRSASPTISTSGRHGHRRQMRSCGTLVICDDHAHAFSHLRVGLASVGLSSGTIGPTGFAAPRGTVPADDVTLSAGVAVESAPGVPRCSASQRRGWRASRSRSPQTGATVLHRDDERGRMSHCRIKSSAGTRRPGR